MNDLNKVRVTLSLTLGTVAAALVGPARSVRILALIGAAIYGARRWFCRCDGDQRRFVLPCLGL
jgi:hypothetical protein